MLFSAFRNTAQHTSMRQLTRLFTCNGNLVGKRVACCWLESKQPNSSCTAHTIYRQYSTESTKKVILPPLMDYPVILYPSMFTIIKTVIQSIFIFPKKNIDPNEFTEGAHYAIRVISNALADQKYETLSGLVDDKVIQILKQKVNSLSSEQRELIRVKEDSYVVSMTSELKVNEINDEDVIEISTILHYFGNDEIKAVREKTSVWDLTEYFLQSRNIIVCNYTFQRRTKNGVDGPWIVIALNHVTAT